MNAVLVGFIAFLATFGGALAGVWLSRFLPEPHLNAETRSAVSVSMAVVGTLAALALSLMITNADSSFKARSDAVASLAVEIVKLDRTLQRYGPDAAATREALRTYTRVKADDVSRGDRRGDLDVSTLRLLEAVDDRLLALHPGDDRQSHLRNDGLTLIHAIADSRWVLVAKSENTVSSPFLSLLIFWLGLLFASFGLFAPKNATVITMLLLCGLAIAGGIFTILELGSATRGLIRISAEPLRAAVAEMSMHQD